MKLLCLILRGLQAAVTGPYGNRLVETFSLDALAAQGVVFETHLAVHPDPVLARRVWRSGCHQFPLPPDLASATPPDLLAALHERGVVTHLVLDTSRPCPVADWSSGWQHVHTEADTASAVTVAEDILAELSETPSWLIWLELSSLLPPWDLDEEVLQLQFAPPPEDEEYEEEEEEDIGIDYLEREEPLEPLLAPRVGAIDPLDDTLYLRMAKTYAAAVGDLDNLLGEFLDGLDDDIHVLMTADHGQALGEHGYVGVDQPRLHQESVHVPLLLVGPGCSPGRRIAALTASIDLAPTIAELAGAALEGAQGRSLVPLLSELPRNWRSYVCLGGRANGPEWALWTPEWAFHLPLAAETNPRVYVKPDDRWEVNDVYQHHLERADTLATTLRAYVAATWQPGPFQPPPLRMPEEDDRDEEAKEADAGKV